MSASSRIREILADPAASHWLKHSLATATERDPIDAFADAEILLDVLSLRYVEATGSAIKPPQSSIW